MSTYSENDELARQSAREAFDRARQAVRTEAAARRDERCQTTSTRSPRLSDFQDQQDFQVKQESHRGETWPSAASNDDSYGDLFASGKFSEIPDQEFIRLAWDESDGTQWQTHGMSETWEFCRYLQAHPNFRELSSGDLVGKLRRLINLEDHILETIVAERDRVVFAQGEGPLEWAVAMASQYPLRDPEDLGLERYNCFISIAGWLQVMRGTAPVFLPVEKLAKLLGVSPRSVSSWRAIAKRQGLLTEVAPYEPRRKATEFRFDIERFGVLRERKNL